MTIPLVPILYQWNYAVHKRPGNDGRFFPKLFLDRLINGGSLYDPQADYTTDADYASITLSVLKDVPMVFSNTSDSGVLDYTNRTIMRFVPSDKTSNRGLGEVAYVNLDNSYMNYPLYLKTVTTHR